MGSFHLLFISWEYTFHYFFCSIKPAKRVFPFLTLQSIFIKTTFNTKSILQKPKPFLWVILWNKQVMLPFQDSCCMLLQNTPVLELASWGSLVVGAESWWGWLLRAIFLYLYWCDIPAYCFRGAVLLADWFIFRASFIKPWIYTTSQI